MVNALKGLHGGVEILPLRCKKRKQTPETCFMCSHCILLTHSLESQVAFSEILERHFFPLTVCKWGTNILQSTDDFP